MNYPTPLRRDLLVDGLSDQWMNDVVCRFVRIGGFGDKVSADQLVEISCEVGGWAFDHCRELLELTRPSNHREHLERGADRSAKAGDPSHHLITHICGHASQRRSG